MNVFGASVQIHRKKRANWHTLSSLMALGALLASIPLSAQVLGAAERAAARAAARNAVRQSERRADGSAATRQAERKAADLLVRRWSTSLCGHARPCPLPENIGNSFRGGSYNEVILGRDTTFYRVYSRSELAYGVPGQTHSFWSRSNARGSRAIIDGAIPVSRNGNIAQRQVAITLPKGTRVFDGYAAPLPRGPVGGGSQVVIERSVLRRTGH